MNTQTQGISGWIVTWDGIGGHVKIDRTEVVDFFGPSAHIEYVRDQVEHKYAEKNYTFEELVASTLDPSKNPYRATVEGSLVHCGHNPFLKARIVDDLVIRRDQDGVVRGTWSERSRSQASAGP
jgi:hypothetical protein